MREIFQTRKFLPGCLFLFLGAAFALTMFLVGNFVIEGFDFSVAMKNETFKMQFIAYVVAAGLSLLPLLGSAVSKGKRGSSAFIGCMIAICTVGFLSAMLLLYQTDFYQGFGYIAAYTNLNQDFSAWGSTFAFNLRDSLNTSLIFIGYILSVGCALLCLIALIVSFAGGRKAAKVLGIIGQIAAAVGAVAFLVGLLLEKEFATDGSILYKFTTYFNIDCKEKLIRLTFPGVLLTLFAACSLFSPVVLSRKKKKEEAPSEEKEEEKVSE